MSTPVLLGVEGLSIHSSTQRLLREVSFALHPGEALTLLGESGAGKSLLAQAIMGNLPGTLQAGGAVLLDGATSRAEDVRARRPRWGRTLALVPQEPGLALDPLVRIAPQLAEVHALLRKAAPAAAEHAARLQLDAVGLSSAAQQYAWQISGGMAQRAVATIALAAGARILLADEPTKGLDAFWRDRTIEQLQAVQRDGGCVLTITHDLRVARALGGRLMVLRDGEVIEQGSACEVLARPQHDFTRRLIAADPAHWPHRPAPAVDGKLLEARGIAKRFGKRVLFEGLDVDLRKGERLVVQGPSGTGKSTLGNVLLGLMPHDAGSVHRASNLPPHGLQKLYQDPVASFAPQVTLERSLRDVAQRHACDWRRVQQHLARLRVPEQLLKRKPMQVSGGELQRVALARVLTVQPALIFADEPTSRLDLISQQETLSALLDAVDATHATLMLVTHDDDVAAAVGTRLLRFGKEGPHPIEGLQGRVAA